MCRWAFFSRQQTQFTTTMRKSTTCSNAWWRLWRPQGCPNYDRSDIGLAGALALRHLFLLWLFCFYFKNNLFNFSKFRIRSSITLDQLLHQVLCFYPQCLWATQEQCLLKLPGMIVSRMSLSSKDTLLRYLDFALGGDLLRSSLLR